MKNYKNITLDHVGDIPIISNDDIDVEGNFSFSKSSEFSKSEIRDILSRMRLHFPKITSVISKTKEKMRVKIKKPSK